MNTTKADRICFHIDTKGHLVKAILILCLSAMLSACAYSYRIGVDENESTEKFAKIQFSNTVKVSEIDNKKFDPKFSIWVQGSHEVALPPGYHTFKFRYNAVSMRGGYYTDSDTILGAALEAGKRYEIATKFEAGKVFFQIRPLEDSPKNSPADTAKNSANL